MAVTADQVLDVISKEVPIDREKLDPAATLAQLDIASLDMITVTFALEDQFGVVVEQSDFADTKTVQDFIDVVVAKSQSAPAETAGS
ncbi:MAG: phosphopantetheine-binding protein [Caulobacteraceae bacterium]